MIRSCSADFSLDILFSEEMSVWTALRIHQWVDISVLPLEWKIKMLKLLIRRRLIGENSYFPAIPRTSVNIPGVHSTSSVLVVLFPSFIPTIVSWIPEEEEDENVCVCVCIP